MVRKLYKDFTWGFGCLVCGNTNKNPKHFTDRFCPTCNVNLRDEDLGNSVGILALPSGMSNIFDPESCVAGMSVEWFANSLSKQCRFNGHVSRFYSIAEHSVLMSRYFYDKMSDTHDESRRKMALEALFHDAHEAVVGDIIRPLKLLIPKFAEIERGIDGAIRKKFTLRPDMPQEIKDFDNIVVTSEARQLFITPIDETYWPKCDTDFYSVRGWDCDGAYGEFLTMYNFLIKDNNII